MARGLGRAFAAGLALAGAAASCHSSGHGGALDADAGALDGATADAYATPFTEAAMRAAATAFNTKYCTAFARCSGAIFRHYYGTIGECIGAGGVVATSFLGERYVSELTAPYAYGSLLTPDDLLACAEKLDLSDANCDAFTILNDEFVLPEACHTAYFGSLPDGSTCWVYNQCKGGRCYAPANSGPGACGECAGTLPAGTTCSFTLQCSAGLGCFGDDPGSLTCKPYRRLGETCGRGMHCQDNLECNAGICARPTTDYSCDPAIGCTGVPIAHCNPVTNRCDAPVFSGIGGPCDPVSGPACDHDGACTRMQDAPADAGSGDAGPVARYACAPLIPDGHACTTAAVDPPCARPDSVCYENICQEKGAAQCSPPPVLP